MGSNRSPTQQRRRKAYDGIPHHESAFMLASQLCTYKAIMTLFGISSATYGDLLCSFQHGLTLL